MTAADPAREIEALLQRGIGLNVGSVGPSMVTLAVRTRMKKRGTKTVSEYAGLLGASETEFHALIEEIVVPETWFFRDREAFALLGQWAVNEWLPAHPYEVLRVISMPCSTGEEPYSIVMALVDAGMPPERFSVEAVDISAEALAKARQAVYNRNAFRGQQNEFREIHFHKCRDGWRLDEQISNQVQFRQANLLDASFDRKEGEMDVVFCRNLMIYFDAPSRARLMTKLDRMLAPEGLLFLGHAEGGISREFGFEPLPKSMVFAFRKSKKKAGATARKAAASKPAAIAPPRAVALPVKPAVPPPRPVIPAPRVKANPPATAPATAETLLAQAEKWADAGRFDAARAECETCLKAHGPSSRVYYLLGLIEDAANQPAQAEAYYRKTLYMEPDHHEALFQLSLLTKKGGNAKAARQLEERARRAQTKAKAKAS
ncbi:MAG: CheR family methyltransferase [Verrucomicrobiota bacterium]